MFQTKGIVLKTIKYGETSQIAHIFTADFGLQTYMVKGLRSSKKSSAHAGVLQPSFVLDLVVCQHPQKNFQRIREMSPDPVFQNAHEDVIKNCIAIFAVELLTQLITENDVLPQLFDFCYLFLKHLAETEQKDCVLLPLYFTLHAARLSGYQINGAYSKATPFLNIAEGCYTSTAPATGPVVETDVARAFSLLNYTADTGLGGISISSGIRKSLLEYFLLFLAWHSPQFRPLKSLEVLRSILH